MTKSILNVELESPLAVLTLTNPERRNALSSEMMHSITTALRGIASNLAIRAVIVRAEGPVFSSGHDLREMTGKDLEHYRKVFDVCTEMMTVIQAIPQPVIAEIDGIATAAGCQMVASCDLALASPRSKFATPGVKIGLFCSTPMVPLTRSIGRKRALEMLLTGEMIDADRAAEWGLINKVVAAERLEEETRELALRIAAASRVTVAMGKQAFYHQVDLEQPEAYEYTKEVMSLNAQAADAQEGMCAFLEKREPAWPGNHPQAATEVTQTSDGSREPARPASTP